MEPLLKVHEVSELLKISVWTLRTWCSQKYIPYIKLHGAVRFRESEIDRWIKKNVSIGRSLHRLRIEAAMRSEEVKN
jgi:excisionase family DNA binding protein